MARPFYSEENESTQESQQDESPVMSPTYSQMINTISLGDEDFEINQFMHNDILSISLCISKFQIGILNHGIETLGLLECLK